MGILCVLVLLSACDVVFRLDRVGGADDAGSGYDALMIDVPTGPCMPTEHNEDNDAVPDRCDVCPGVADNQVDSDKDGVGDACDPGDAAQHTLAKFITFAEPSNTWMAQAGMWMNDGESLKYTSYAMPSHGSVKYTGTLPEPPYVVEAHFQIDAVGNEVAAFYMRIDTNQTVMGGTGVACSFDRFINPLRDTVRALDTTSGVAASTNLVPMVSPGGYRMVATYTRSQNLSCYLSADDQSTSGTAPQPTQPISPGAFGFRSYKVGATLNWIAIYKTL